MAETRTIERIAMTRSSCPLLQWDAWDDPFKAFGDFAADRLGGSLPGQVGQMAVLAEVTAVKVAPRRFWLVARTGDDLPRGLPRPPNSTSAKAGSVSMSGRRACATCLRNALPSTGT